MSDFKRRPFMAGHTDVFILSQPYISGTEHINSDGQLDSIEALVSGGSVIELSFETESGSGDFQLDLSVATDTERTLAGIVEAINTSFGSLVTAADFEGCLRLQTVSSGYDAVNGNAYIRILPNQSGALIEDAAPLFGFPRHPHPEATTTAGDLASAPVRPLTQVNRPGVAFLARGEDRVSQNFNRALHQLAINADSLNTRLKERVPVPTVIDLASTSLRLITDVDGSILGVDLSAGYGDGIDNIITPTSSVFVGGSELSATSSLAKIAEFFSVQDQDDNEIQADERVVRVGAVINGFLAGSVSVPAFVSETSPPTSALPDAATYTGDYGNLLGVAVPKVAATAITAVRDGSVLECETATFETDNVLKGDIVTISGSTINSPINHDGDYYVETVISETELEVRPLDSENVILLNESSGAGLGSVEISTDTKFARAEKCVLLFSPPIADFPPDRLADDGLTTIDGVLRIVLGVEAPLGEVPTTFLTRSTILTSAEVDAFVTRRLWRRMSFDGVYQGQSYDYRGSQKGGGAEGRITHGPISLNLVAKQARVAPTLTSGSGSFEMRGSDIVLTTAASTVLSDTDIGRVIYMTDTDASPLFADATPFVLSEFLSYREARLTPPVDYKDWRDSDLPAGTSHTCTFDIADEGQAAVQAAMLFVANDETFDEVTAAKTGTVFIRNHRDGADDEVSPGTSTLHVERIRHLRADATGSTAVTDARFLTVTTSGKTVVLDRSGDVVYPEYNMNLFYSKGSTTRSAGGVGCTLLRIVNGENAGFYEVYDHNTSTGTFDVRPIENAFDGQDNSWAGFATPTVTEVGNLYNVVFSAGGKRSVDDPVDGALDVISGITAFADAADKSAYGAATAVARAIQAHWIGTGAGLVVRVNDPEFISLSFDNASVGDAIDIAVWAPADGIKVQAIGSSVGAAAAGRTYGLSVTAEGYGTDASKSTPDEAGVDILAARSYAAAISQFGRDTGLVVAKYEGAATSSSPLDAALLSSGAALIVARRQSGTSRAVSGMGSAIETVGSIWVHSPLGSLSDTFAGGTDHALGGIYSEDAVGAGRWLYPMWGYDTDRHYLTQYETTPPLTVSGSWDGPTVLGNPGIILPAQETDVDPTGAFGEADFSLFNFHHDAILAVTLPSDVGFFEPLNKYVGCIVECTESGASVEGEKYAIVGVMRPDPIAAIFALRGTPVTTTFGGYFRVRGLRWDQTYADMADFFHVGTWNSLIELNTLPLVGADETSLLTRASHLLPSLNANDYTNIPNLSRHEWSPGADGSGIGSGQILGLMSGTDLTDGSDTSLNGWSGTFDAPLHIHMWADNTREPRPPFASESMVGVERDGSVTGGHAFKDFVYYDDGDPADNVEYSPYWGGVLEVSIGISSAVHLVKRGRRYRIEDHTALRVTLRAFVPTTSGAVGSATMISVDLRNATDDSIVASGTIDYDGIVVDELADYTIDLAVDNTRFRAKGAIGDSKVNDELVVHVSFPHVGLPTGTQTRYVQEIRVESIKVPLVVNAPLVVNGPVYADGFRYTSPVRGYESVGPMQVSLFGGADYGTNRSWPKQNILAGMQELRGGPGLLRTTTFETLFSREELWGWMYDNSDDGTTPTAVYQVPDAWLGIKIDLPSPVLETYPYSRQDYIDLLTAYVFRSDLYTGTTAYPGCVAFLAAEYNGYIADYAGAPSIPAEREAWKGILETATRIAVHARDMVRYTPDFRLSDYTNGTLAWDETQDAYARNLFNALSGVDGEGFLYPPSSPTPNTRITASADLKNALRNMVESVALDRWVRPNVDEARLFTKGPHSATITLYNGAYHPLWYALHAHLMQNNIAADTNGVIRNEDLVPCGHVGFVSALTPPHGSLLTSLEVSLSVRPQWPRDEDYPTNWGVYYDMPSAFKSDWGASGLNYSDVAAAADWEGDKIATTGKTGVYVEIWRHSTAFQGDSVKAYSPGMNSQLERNFGELVFRAVVAEDELAKYLVPAVTKNREQAWKGFFIDDYVYLGQEYAFNSEFDLLKEVENGTGRVNGDYESVLRVDRRHFSYSLVVRFMGGPSRPAVGGSMMPFSLSDPDSTVVQQNNTGDPRWDEPTVGYPFRQPHFGNELDGATAAAVVANIEGWLGTEEQQPLSRYGTFDAGPDVVPYGSPVLDRNFHHVPDEDANTPQVKFRGAVLSWLTDRGGEGGWGS